MLLTSNCTALRRRVSSRARIVWKGMRKSQLPCTGMSALSDSANASGFVKHTAIACMNGWWCRIRECRIIRARDHAHVSLVKKLSRMRAISATPR
jgi:hypothetical protein